MKEKVRFTKRVVDIGRADVSSHVARKVIIAMVLVGVIITAIVCSCWYAANKEQINKAFDSYSPEVYEQLEEIATNVVKEGEGIDLKNIPESVVKYEITWDNQQIVFCYYLDNNKGIKFAERLSGNMKIVLSDEYKIISEDTNFLSEREYHRAISLELVVCIICLIFVTVAVYSGSILVILMLLKFLLSLCAIIERDKEEKK